MKETNMIKNIPTSDEFYLSGKELLNFSWDILITLLKDLNEATTFFDVNEDEVIQAYWDSARKHLSTSLSIMQQGVELILKGKITYISPYLLITDSPSKWPSPYKNNEISFSQFRTLDAQDLIKVHDIFADTKISDEFANLYNSLREKRNAIMHSVDNNLKIEINEIIENILAVHNSLFSNENWAQERHNFLNKSPGFILSGESDYNINTICWEISLVYELLSPICIKKYFNINKKNNLYFCPKCYENANHDADSFDYKLAGLISKNKDEKELFCPVCNITHEIIRNKCIECEGTVFDEMGQCLTCRSIIE